MSLTPSRTRPGVLERTRGHRAAAMKIEDRRNINLHFGDQYDTHWKRQGAEGEHHDLAGRYGVAHIQYPTLFMACQWGAAP
jgi:hypothetical protein